MIQNSHIVFHWTGQDPLNVLYQLVIILLIYYGSSFLFGRFPEADPIFDLAQRGRNIINI